MYCCTTRKEASRLCLQCSSLCPVLSRVWPSCCQGCELINQQAGDGEYLENIDVILGVMDMDNNDSIDINEFFEVRWLVGGILCVVITPWKRQSTDNSSYNRCYTDGWTTSAFGKKYRHNPIPNRLGLRTTHAWVCLDGYEYTNVRTAERLCICTPVLSLYRREVRRYLKQGTQKIGRSVFTARSGVAVSTPWGIRMAGLYAANAASDGVCWIG